MSRLISEILNAPEPSFSQQLEQLELLSGRPGLDIKLATEMKQIFRQKAQTLKLDQHDTTPKELYFSMSRLALENSEQLAKVLDINPTDTPGQMVEKSANYVIKRIGKRNIWALKSRTARRQLSENPPKKLMKIFAIRSIDSAIKRERISLFYCFANFVEPPKWFDKYVSQAEKLTNSDFDNQPITISIVSELRKSQLKKAGVKLNHIIYSDQESAGIEIVVPDKRFAGDVLFIVDSLFTQVRKMLRRSAYYKHQGLLPEFFSKVEKARAGGFRYVEMDNHPFDWPTLVHATTELGIPGLIHQANDLHISSEDLLAPSVAKLGGFDFWNQPFAMHKEDGLIISFNLSDMIINAVNSTLPAHSYVENGRDALRWELFGRYLHYEQVHRHATDSYNTEQLD